MVLLTDLLLHLPVLLMLLVVDMEQHHSMLPLLGAQVDQDLVEHQVEVVDLEHQGKEILVVVLVMWLMDLGEQAAEERLHRGAAAQPGGFGAPGVEDAVGEDVAALEQAPAGVKESDPPPYTDQLF